MVKSSFYFEQIDRGVIMLKRAAIFLTLTMGLQSTPVQSQSLERILGGVRVINEADRILRQGPGTETAPSVVQKPRETEPRSVPQQTMSRADVREIQFLLAQAGYDPGPADGIMGSQTGTAIGAFQRDHGFQVTGRPSSRLQEDLRRSVAHGAGRRDRPVASSGPSFDCGKATTATELAICGSSDLGELDRAIARNYSAAYEGAQGAAREQLLADQRSWLAQRDACGGDVQCLTNRMGPRASQLAGVAAGTGGTPPVASTGAEGGAAAAGATEVAGNGAVDQGETLLITYTGSGSGIRPESEEQQRQRDLLARTVSSKVLGTELEPVFLDQQPLTQAQVHQIFETAGVPIPQVLQIQMDRERVKNATDVRFNADLSRSDINEFGRQRIEAAMRDTARAAMIADAIDTPLPLTLICGIGTDAYDFERQMFPFDEDDIKYCFAGNPNNVGSLRGHKTQLPIQTDFRPEGYPVDPSTAEQIVDELGGSRFALAIPATVTGRIASDRNGRPEFVFQVTPTGPLEVRPGPDLTRVLHVFSSDQMRDVNDTPEARRLADFDRAWWLESSDEIDIVAARASAAAVSAIDNSSLFDASTGLTFAFRGAYHEGLTTGARSLADFVETRSDREMMQLSQAMNIPVGNLVEVALPLVGTTNARFRGAVIVLPQALSAYPVTDALPAYEKKDGGWPFSNVELNVTAEHVVTAPDGREFLLLAGHPERLVVRRSSSKVKWQDAAEIAHVVFSEMEQKDYESVDLAWHSDLISDAQDFFDLPLAEIIQQQVGNSRVGGSDAFAKRAAATELLELSIERANASSVPWVKAGIRMDAYDFDREGWPVRSISLSFNERAPEADRAMSITVMSNADDRGIFIPAPPDVAQALQNNSESFPKLDALMSIRVTGVDTSYGSNPGKHITLLYEPMEVVLFDAGKSQLVIEDQDILLRHRYVESEGMAQSPDDVSETDDVSISPGSFSILDVAIGDDFQTSVNSLSSRIGADMRYQATVEDRQEYVKQNNVRAIDNFDAYHSAILLEASGKKELVAIYHEAPGLEDTVTAVSRTRLFPEGGRPTWEQLRKQILRTYEAVGTAVLPEEGQPTSIEIWDWPPDTDLRGITPDQRTCMRSVMTGSKGNASAMARDKKRRTQGYFAPVDTRAAWFDENGDVAVPSVASPLSLPMLFGDAAECPDHEVMVLALSYDADGKIEEFRQAISNPSAINRISVKQRGDASEVQSTEADDFDL